MTEAEIVSSCPKEWRMSFSGETTMHRTKLLVVESNRIMREGLKEKFAGLSDIEVPATSNLQDAIAVARAVKPEIILIDLATARELALPLIEALKLDAAEVQVIGMGVIPNQLEIIEYVRSGVTSFVLKDAGFDEVISTVRSVVEDQKTMPPQLVESLFSQIVGQSLKSEPTLKMPDDVQMTRREQEVIDLISEGLSNKEIADRLCVAIHTVKSHVHNVLEKLALDSRLQIATFVHGQLSQKNGGDTLSAALGLGSISAYFSKSSEPN